MSKTQFQIHTIERDDSFSLKQIDDITSPLIPTSNNPFSNPKVAEHYRQLYESTQYECRHQFDPDLTWSKSEEASLLVKLDKRVAFLSCFLFVALQIDRGNLSQAVADNMLDDLGMTTDQYNNGNSIFYLSFLAAELPSQLISKRLGCDIWVPIEMCLWSIASISQCRLKTATGFYITRALMGVLEGGFIPQLVLWMSYFYTASELSIRLAFFYTSLSISEIISSIIAGLIFRMRGIYGMQGWSWVFLIEGFFTLIVGVSSFFLMVPSAVQTKKSWNPEGWFTDREEKIVVNRLLRDDPSKGSMFNRQGLSLKMLLEGISDWHLWPIYLIGIVAYIPAHTLGSYLTLVLKGLGYSTFTVNLMAIPSIVLTFILLLSITWLSERCHSIFNVALLQPLWAVPLLAVLRWWKGSFDDKWSTYIIISLILATPYIHAMMVSACSRNAQSVKTRAVSASLYNMFVQAGSIIASNIYRSNDAPYYRAGNTRLFWSAFAMFPILILTKLMYVTINRSREKKWRSMDDQEREEYSARGGTGSERLDFRFFH